MEESRFKKVETDKIFKQDLKELMEQVQNESAVREMVKGVKFHLERNAELCPCVNGTNVHYYQPRKIRGIPSLKILFVINRDRVILCAIDSENK